MESMLAHLAAKPEESLEISDHQTVVKIAVMHVSLFHPRPEWKRGKSSTLVAQIFRLLSL